VAESHDSLDTYPRQPTLSASRPPKGAPELLPKVIITDTENGQIHCSRDLELLDLLHDRQMAMSLSGIKSASVRRNKHLRLEMPELTNDETRKQARHASPSHTGNHSPGCKLRQRSAQTAVTRLGYQSPWISVRSNNATKASHTCPGDTSGTECTHQRMQPMPNKEYATISIV
jgi:hypothetical protein